MIDVIVDSDSAIVMLAGRSTVHLLNVRLISDLSPVNVEEFEASLLLEEIITIGSFSSSEDLSVQFENVDICFLSSYCVCGHYIFLTSDRTLLQVRNRHGEVVCTFPSEDYSQRRIQYAKFHNDNSIITAYSDGTVALLNIFSRGVIWSHTISALVSRNGEEFVTSISVLDNEKVFVGSNRGNCFVLQLALDESKNEHLCWERYHNSLDRLMRGGPSGTNSVLTFSPFFDFHGKRYIFIISSLLVAILNIESGEIESAISLALLSPEVPYLSYPLMTASTTHNAELMFCISSFERKLSEISTKTLFESHLKPKIKVPSSIFSIERIEQEFPLSVYASVVTDLPEGYRETF